MWAALEARTVRVVRDRLANCTATFRPDAEAPLLPVPLRGTFLAPHSEYLGDSQGGVRLSEVGPLLDFSKVDLPDGVTERELVDVALDRENGSQGLPTRYRVQNFEDSGTGTWKVLLARE